MIGSVVVFTIVILSRASISFNEHDILKYNVVQAIFSYENILILIYDYSLQKDFGTETLF